jgi:ABC-2 type transport system permease protein
MNTNVLFAVFKRNFVSYFANPTGYLFICVFVLMCSASAFWPPDFFNNNLANLDQLSWGIQILGFRFGFSIIMLVFIPSITMSMWAEERRQGTDELLLTIPAGDFDIVLGKYLAAVAIFSVSLIFSLICNFTVLKWLGAPDIGLFLGTYFGYWLIGLAMLAVGMAASFLTSNLTVGYILGVLLNAPLVFASAAEVLCGPTVAGWLKNFSIGEQFSDFGHGLISLSGIVYFLSIVVVMLYLSMVLIGRRHWVTGRQGSPMGIHYALRFAALVVIAIGATTVFGRHDLRCDVTSEQLSSLAPDTKRLLADLKLERPVQIEAFVSPEVPEAYVQTRLNLLTTLREFQALGKGMIRVTIHNAEPYSSEADLADKRFGIEPRKVPTRNHGVISFDNIFMAVAVKSGLERVVLPFIDRGIPFEYELIRSLGTVTQEKRKRVGVLTTDAQVMGRFNPMNPNAAGNWPIIDELEKQYEVVQVNPAQPITEKYDVLLAVQPSSLGPEEMNNFIAAVESGQPTAIFEDPLPVLANSVSGTMMPRRPPGGMESMMMGMRPQPKGDINRLWALLGLDFYARGVILQDYNPYPKTTQLPKEFVFIDKGEGNPEPFGTASNISMGLQQVLFPFPGSMKKLNISDFKYMPLAITGDNTGTVAIQEVLQMSPFGPRGLNESRRPVWTAEQYVLAAEIEGKIKPPQPPAEDKTKTESDQSKTDDPPADEKGKGDDKKPATPADVNIHVVVVADIDMLAEEFFRLREMGDSLENEINFQFDNVTFILNVLDKLAGDNRFIEIRKRRPQHRILTRIEDETKTYQKKVAQSQEKYIADVQKAEEAEKKVIIDTVKELQSRKDGDAMQMLIDVQMTQEDLNRKMEAKLDRIKKEKKQEVDKTETEYNQKKRSYQDLYKMLAVILPPIPPLLLAIVVFSLRRSREREGIAKSRLR